LTFFYDAQSYSQSVNSGVSVDQLLDCGPQMAYILFQTLLNNLNSK